MAYALAEDAVKSKLMQLKAACPPILQKYGREPPGEGLGVVYAAFCTTNGKMYIGQHAHGVSGTSVYTARWKPHLRSKEVGPLFNAIRKHGAGAFEWCILDHCLEDDLNDQEIAMISKWNTRVPLGYNQEKGGRSGPRSARGLQALRIANRKEDKRSANGVLAKARWEDNEYRKQTVESMKAAANQPKRLLQNSKDARERWSDPNYHKTTVESMKAAQNTPNAREANRKKARDFWDQPENKEKMRAKAKKRVADNGSGQMQKAAQAAWANPETVERIKAARKATWEDPAYAEKRWKTFNMKREKALAACKTPQERRAKANQYARTDKRRERRLASGLQKH